MKKVFISQPMNGKSDSEIIEKRAEIKLAVEFLLGEEVEVLDSFFQGEKRNPVKMLASSIELLADADYVFFTEDWKDARGCRCEHQIACAYRKNTITEYPNGQYQMFVSID